jgi:hypothetical protein
LKISQSLALIARAFKDLLFIPFVSVHLKSSATVTAE